MSLRDDAIRASWQGKLLAYAKPGRMQVAILSMIAHVFDDDLILILNAIRPHPIWDPGKRTLRPPFLFTIGRINYQGNIDAGVIQASGEMNRCVIFASTRDFEYELRKLADRTMLDDSERLEFFKMAAMWVASDQRLDPTMDPRDPDARRLTRH